MRPETPAPTPETPLLAPSEPVRLDPVAEAVLAWKRGEGPLPALRHARLVGLDLGAVRWNGVDLTGADLSHCNLEGAMLIGANLEGAVLREANCTRAEFGGANLRNTEWLRARLRGASLSQCDLTGAHFESTDFEGASLLRVHASGARFPLADLRGTRMQEAQLENCAFSKADLRNAHLDRARLVRCDFSWADLRGASLRNMQGYRSSNWLSVDLREVDFTGAYLFRRFVQDQNYLDEFRKQSKWHELVYHLWWLTSDCGRSLTRWSLFTVVLILGFAFTYHWTELDFGPHAGPLSTLYFSVVTMTTLGYGDVMPASTGAQIIAMVQVSTGYVMLGGLVSILSSKLARRGD
ncbi:MAG: pentapeptide repeat-containing protein [Planctomycetota bacterium]